MSYIGVFLSYRWILEEALPAQMEEINLNSVCQLYQELDVVCVIFRYIVNSMIPYEFFRHRHCYFLSSHLYSLPLLAASSLSPLPWSHLFSSNSISITLQPPYPVNAYPFIFQIFTVTPKYVLTSEDLGARNLR